MWLTTIEIPHGVRHSHGTCVCRKADHVRQVRLFPWGRWAVEVVLNNQGSSVNSDRGGQGFVHGCARVPGEWEGND